jgi:hypothetical protein
MKTPRYLFPKDYMADPSANVFNDRLYIFPSHDRDSGEAFDDDGGHFQMKDYHVLSLTDVENGEVTDHGMILDVEQVPWADRQMWDNDVVEKDGKYYLIFSAKDPNGVFHLGVAVADKPEGPFIPEPHPIRGSFSIDPCVFKDDDGQIYLYYGGWRHMMVCKMNPEMNGFLPMPEPCVDGIAREITPKDYVEAPYVMKIDGKYTLMYSSGKWTNGTYCVKAGVTDDPCTEFEYYGDVLKAAEIADGPGHNSAFFFKGEHYVAYHRRAVGDTNPHHRKLCIDKLPIKDGKLQAVTMT